MHIPVVCPHCQQAYKIDPKMAGKQFRCNQCQSILTVPVVAPVSDAPPPPPPPRPAAPARPRPPAPAPSPAVRRPARPRPTAPAADEIRVNMPYESGFLNGLDAFFNIAGQAGFWLVLAIFLMLTADAIREIYLLATALNSMPIAVLIMRGANYPVLFAFWALVHITLCVYAAALAGNIFKFELPDEPRWRTIGAQIGAGIYVAIGWALILLIRMASTGSPPAGISDANHAVPSLILFTLPLAIPTHFFLTWLLLRVRFTEALVAWLLQGVATLLSIGVLTLLWFAERALLPRLLA